MKTLKKARNFFCNVEYYNPFSWPVGLVIKYRNFYTQKMRQHEKSIKGTSNIDTFKKAKKYANKEGEILGFFGSLPIKAYRTLNPTSDILRKFLLSSLVAGFTLYGGGNAINKGNQIVDNLKSSYQSKLEETVGLSPEEKSELSKSLEDNLDLGTFDDFMLGASYYLEDKLGVKLPIYKKTQEKVIKAKNNVDAEIRRKITIKNKLKEEEAKKIKEEAKKEEPKEISGSKKVVVIKRNPVISKVPYESRKRVLECNSYKECMRRNYQSAPQGPEREKAIREGAKEISERFNRKVPFNK